MQTLDILLKKIDKKTKILLMFDYDGTLTPIVAQPDQAILDPNIKNHLEKIAEIDFIKLVLVSGRNVDTLKKLSSITHPNISMHGLYGGEIYVNGITKKPKPEIKKQIIKIKENLNELSTLSGILIEDKIYSISLHYRHSDFKNSQKAIKLFIQKTGHLVENNEFVFLKGKKVLELLPKSFNKLNSVKLLMQENKNYFPVYFGDDEPDLLALKEVKDHNGMAVGIGELPFDSINFKSNINDLYQFLEKTAQITQFQ